MEELQDKTLYEGLNFEERLEVRRRLITQYGTSLPEKEKESHFAGKKEGSKNDNQNEKMELEDPKIYEGKSFNERLEVRRKLIEKYGTSLNNKNQDGGTFEKKTEGEDKEKLKLTDPKIYEGKKFNERLEIRKKLISQYGTSLIEGKKEEKKEKKKEGKQKIADFDTRVKKRRIISKIENDKKIDRQKKKVILDNKLEFINDPDIIIDEEANICYVTDKKIKEKVEYKKIPGVGTEIMKGDEFSGSYQRALDRARILATKNLFPNYYIPWSESRSAYRTSLLDRVPSVKAIISNKEFYPVRNFTNLILGA